MEVGQDGLPKLLSQRFVHCQGCFFLINKGLVQDARALVSDLRDPPLVGAVPVHALVGRVARGALLV